VLTITLNDKSTVSGKVTDQTELHCQPATPPPTTTSGDDQGGGDDQSAADSGEHGGPSTVGQQQGDSQGGDGSGDGNNGGEDDNEEGCTKAALVPGAKVGESELSLSSAGAVWEKVDLIG
jgi:hypothetical protein